MTMCPHTSYCQFSKGHKPCPWCPMAREAADNLTKLCQKQAGYSKRAQHHSSLQQCPHAQCKHRCVSERQEGTGPKDRVHSTPEKGRGGVEKGRGGERRDRLSTVSRAGPCDPAITVSSPETARKDTEHTLHVDIIPLEQLGKHEAPCETGPLST